MGYKCPMEERGKGGEGRGKRTERKGEEEKGVGYTCLMVNS